MKYEVQQYFECSGWTSTFAPEDEDGTRIPAYFDTTEAAQAEIDAFFDEIQSQIETGERPAENGYSRQEFRVVSVPPT
jgi:hypothetical protein